jgi:hypothetical protein
LSVIFALLDPDSESGSTGQIESGSETLDVDTDLEYYLIRIRMQIRIIIDVDADPNPLYQKDGDPCGSESGCGSTTRENHLKTNSLVNGNALP